MTKELVAQLYSSEAEVKRAAIYRVLFDRRHDLLPELKKAASFEQNEEVAVFMVQVGLTLEAFPRDSSLERRIIEFLQRPDGAGLLSESMWKYLMNNGSSQMLIAALAAMGEAIPPDAQEFIEACLNHPDPDIRAMACEKAIKSGRPTHFAYVLNLITDPDPLVAETAFCVVRDMPVNELSIILDYALGSPDEWVLNNVAPFLPLLINNGLRQVIAKVQYHKHPLVSKKAREALKTLDSIPYVSKRKKADEAFAESALADAAIEADSEAEDVEPAEKALSFKEQMELKRLQKMEEERRRQAEEEELNAELAKVQPEDIAGLEGQIAAFDTIASGGDETSLNFDDDVPDENDFLQHTSFEAQAAMLNDIEVDDSMAEAVHEVAEPCPHSAVEPLPAQEASQSQENMIYGAQSEGIAPSVAADVYSSESTFKKDVSPACDSDSAAAAVMDLEAELPPTDIISFDGDTIDFAAAQEDMAPSQTQPVTLGENAEDVANTDKTHNIANAANIENTDNLVKIDNSDNLDSRSATSSIAGKGSAENAVVIAVQPTISETIEADDDDMQILVVDENVVAKPEPVPDAARVATTANVKEVKQIQPTDKQVALPRPQLHNAALPAAAREIVARYPSFIADPFLQLFQTNRHDMQLKAIGVVVDNLIAFLNLCYLQSCLFFAPESEVLSKSIKECIKGHLVGPTALRCLHNFALAMKKTRSNPVFFTFSLAGILSESSDTNPLMMMRELKEFLRSPVLPLEESMPQAIDGLTEILRGVKSILNNSLVMKAPPGAKEPFADPSGPQAIVLAPEKRPGLDLPVGEIVMLSRDGSEALGLFPYFKYSRKKIVFARPDDKEIAVLLERLEIGQV